MISRLRHLRYLLAATMTCALQPFAGELSAQTIIESEALVMQGHEDRNEFTFSGGVRVESEDLVLTCNELFVLALRSEDDKPAKGEDETVGRIGAIERITAIGNVEIRQGGRLATAGRAEVSPEGGILTLSESPKIIDENATVEGWKIILNRDSRTAQVLPEPSEAGQPGKRSRVVLTESAIPRLDYESVQQPEIPPLEGAQQEPQEQQAPETSTDSQ